MISCIVYMVISSPEMYTIGGARILPPPPDDRRRDGARELRTREARLMELRMVCFCPLEQVAREASE